MKTTTRHLFAVALACVVPLLPSCGTTGALNPAASTGITIGTSLAVNAYPAAAPFVETAANALREISAKVPPTPAQVSAYLVPFQAASAAFAGKVSAAAASDVNKFFAAVASKYAADYPAIVKGEMTVESFAQAVEAGA